MSGDIKDIIKDVNIITEYKEETWGKNVEGEYVTDGYKFRGKQAFKKAREELEKLMVRGAQFDVGNFRIQILDARNKGIELEVDVRMNEIDKDNRGFAIVKLYGPNKRKENTVTVTKSKQSDVKFVTLMAEKVIKPLINTFLGKDNENIVKQVSNTNKCEFCEKTFKTIRALKGHTTKKHKLNANVFNQTLEMSKTESEILLIENEDKEEEANLEEVLDIKEERRYTSKCGQCDEFFQTSKKFELIKILLKHNKEACGLTKVKQNIKGKFCPTCNFEVNNELQLKRHKRDKHDIQSVSTSPPPKKTKISQNELHNIQEQMDLDESNQEDMDVDINESEEDIRSRMMDEKVEAKAKKIEAEEKVYQDRKKMEEERIKEKEASELEKQKLSAKKKKQKVKMEKKKSRKNSEKEKINSIFSNMKPLPKNIAHLCKKGDIVYTVPGDGACGANSIAAYLFKDEVFGPKLRQKINDFKVKHWERKYKYKTQCDEESPFIRNVGTGEKVVFTDPEKLFEYLQNNPKAGYMWADCEDFIIVADMYQVRIKVITTKGENDKKPLVAYFQPDEEMKKFAELKETDIGEIVLLHENDVHFNLIISEEDELAKTGSLSFMTNIGPIYNTKEPVISKSYADAVAIDIDYDKNSEDELKKLKNVLKANDIKIKNLEKQYDECEAALKKAVEESEKLKSELKDLQNIKELEKELQKTPNDCIKTMSHDPKFQEIRINKEEHKPEETFIEGEFNCVECDYQATLEDQLNKHILLKHRLQCRNCEKIFETKPKLLIHRKQEHYDLVAVCKKGKDCNFLEKCWWKHNETYENKIECYFCELSFDTKGGVMMHRKEQHPKTVKYCTKFQNKNCNFSETNCWFKHETEKGENNKSERLNPKNLDFQKRQNISKSP